MDKASMSHLISFSRYQAKCIIKFLFRQLMTSQIFGSTSKAMADREKRGEEENAKCKYLKNEKRFLDEIKNIFHSF